VTGWQHRLLSISVADGPVPYIVYGLAIVAVVYLAWRRPMTRRWVVTGAIGILGAAAIAEIAIFVVQDWRNVFGVPMSILTRVWVIGTCAAVGLAVVNLWRSRWRRKILAMVAIVVIAIAGVIGVNNSIGITKNIGDLLGTTTERPLDVATLAPHSTNPPGPLYLSWTPPADMPTHSIHRSIEIPNTESGFPAREAIVYLPPAAQLPDAPALPVIVFMSGQPGAPDVSDIGASLDVFAAANHGLAPIVVSVDQLGGDSGNNPLCVDGYQGKAQTYINVDVPAFVQSTFNVIPDRTDWTIAGFSNGGGCAIKSAAQFSAIWGNVIDISGELQPSLGTEKKTLAIGFGGSQAAFDAAKPLTILGDNAYTDTTAVFADGTLDEPYLTASKTLYAAAAAAGMDAYLFVSPGTGHDADTMAYGFSHAFQVLYPRWGLAPPA
jgi:enterochelin esterase-like enzyme